jgi:hypothetical protein
MFFVVEHLLEADIKRNLLYPFIVLRSVRGRGGVDNKPLKNNYN